VRPAVLVKIASAIAVPGRPVTRIVIAVECYITMDVHLWVPVLEEATTYYHLVRLGSLLRQ